MNNQQNNSPDAEAQQAAFAQQQRIAYQQQQQMFAAQQRMMICQQLQGALMQLDPTQVIKAISNYGVSLPLDPFEKQAILQQLSAIFFGASAGKMPVDSWEALAQAVADALSYAQRAMISQQPMMGGMPGMGGMGMMGMQQPMMGGMGMMGGMPGMNMMQQPMMGGMPGMGGMGMMGMQQPMMGGMGMMGGMPGMNMMGMVQQPTQSAAADSKDPAAAAEARIAQLRQFINCNIASVDPIILIQCIFARNITFDSVPELDQVLRVAIANSTTRVPEAVLQIVYSVVSSLFQQKAPAANGQQQNAQQNMMGGMPGMGMMGGMGMGMPGMGMNMMQQPMMGGMGMMGGMPGMGGMGMMPPTNGMMGMNMMQGGSYNGTPLY